MVNCGTLRVQGTSQELVPPGHNTKGPFAGTVLLCKYTTELRLVRFPFPREMLLLLPQKKKKRVAS